ncbi:PIN domain-containing protein [Sorangium sp. So ce119]|uniref:PIN domain-containing protein n=1 Tax=Sorangium sp. So ce119 TaxID=3133279 RepID=UPI003F5D9C70
MGFNNFCRCWREQTSCGSTTTVAELAGRIRADLERLGSKLTIEDTLIAATAIRHGLPIATGNTRHFVKIQDAGYPLVLENWREPTL